MFLTICFDDEGKKCSLVTIFTNLKKCKMSSEVTHNVNLGWRRGLFFWKKLVVPSSSCPILLISKCFKNSYICTIFVHAANVYLSFGSACFQKQHLGYCPISQFGLM